MSEMNGTSTGQAVSSTQQILSAESVPPKGSVIMSGMRSTHHLHLGNFHGALKNWLDLQKNYQGYYGVMNWHSMTSKYKEPHDVMSFAREIFIEWIAWGLSPKTNVLFIQSEVPEHIELTMFFMMLTPMSWLERVPTWKDAEAEAKATDTHNLGRFMYPVLQAADIAVYRGTHVPIGQDQIPHLELSREIIRRFNFLYGGDLPEPKPIFSETPLLMGSDGRKMSKSYNNGFLLTQEPDAVVKTLRAMPTDTKRVRRTDPGEPKDCPVYSYHKLYSDSETLGWVESGCRSASIGCGDCKMKLAEKINSEMEQPLARKKELLNSPETLDSIIADGCERARSAAKKQLDQIKDWTGFKPTGAWV